MAAWSVVRHLACIVPLLLGSAAGLQSASAAPLDDIHYGPDDQQVLDLHGPAPSAHPAPVVVLFHGGAFVGGDKHPCAPELVARLNRQGVALACANYRLAPRVTYPAPMLDGARAVQWLRAHAADYGLDPSRVAVMGISAGGGIALWVAFHGDLADPANADPVLRQSTRVSAVVTSNAQATYDPATIASDLHTRRYPQFLADLFGTGSIERLTDAPYRAAEQDASPMTHMHAGEPPLLAYYTSQDGTDLAPDTDWHTYIHHPAQGAILQRVARERGAAMDLHTGRDYSWAGFLDAATHFLAIAFGV